MNIHHLETFPHEKIDFPHGIIHDTPRMLAHVAIHAARQRQPLNCHSVWLGHEGGIGNAANLIKHANRMPVFPDAPEEEPNGDGFDENNSLENRFWIFSRRLDSMHLAGSVIVQKGVSLLNELDETIVDNGILVEAVTVTGQEHELANFYKKGINFASKKAKDGEIVFSIEAAEPESEKQSKIKKWISGGLEYNHEIPMSVFRNYSFKEKITARRSDFRSKKAVPAIIYTNQRLYLTS
jgi:hypothetical protein